jgi:hypothetical protein
MTTSRILPIGRARSFSGNIRQFLRTEKANKKNNNQKVNHRHKLAPSLVQVGDTKHYRNKCEKITDQVH